MLLRMDGIDLKQTTTQMELLVTFEIIVRDAIFDADTVKSENYLEHIQKCGEVLGS